MLAAALIYIFAVISPGPNFLLVSRFAAANSIRAGVGASMGIVMVGLMFSISSVTGLAVLIGNYPWFSPIATLAGAIYLIYIAFLLARSAMKSADPAAGKPQAMLPMGFWRAWRTGVLINLTNRKTIAFMVSIFAGFLAVERSLLEKAAVIAICSSFEILWYSSVALIFGQSLVQSLYLRYGRQIDACMAVFLLLFAVETLLMIRW
ncbi:LysE family translocator [Verminephrobacter aporrectodeae]|uniref:LysE family translocator n=1 Tax=Verminephrobacter aporrectodeae TaxID=1110389 RepID=UPI0022432C9D|nr:LysE family translocator [Verminephrobacter aporrectodeae]MCW8173937.1 LysE family translocator [Verminephrobacter aporrectodeae subsp. tuberculatae]MCW8202064.1 LysE family translocator [Verminephrobacter aporrectodeae subsp. tuberculatae]